MEAFPRSRLAASAAVGAVVFGAAVAVVGWHRAADPRVTAAGLLTAGVLALALLLMAWARRRTGVRPSRRRGAEASRDAGRLAVVPLGDGQAAVIWDETAPPGRARPAGGGSAELETAAATAAIWDAVEAAVRAAGAAPPPGPARRDPKDPRRPRRPWGRRPRGDGPLDSR